MTNTIKFSDKAQHLRQSGIRAASTRCAAIGGINLGQGVCDIPAHDSIKQAATAAIFADKNLYAPHEGVFALRQALAEKIQKFNHVTVNPQTDILISHGSTGSFVSAAKALFNPGDEVILFEPFYGYHKYILELLGINTTGVSISAGDYAIDFDHLNAAVNSKTRGIVICSPCNPSGKVFSKEELIKIGEFAEKHDLFIITDEIYEYITYPGYEHVSIASLNNFKERTISISGFSKTYNITGWRLGYSYGPAAIIEKMALVHDLLYICPPTPLQHAMISALHLDDSYYKNLCNKFLINRDLSVKTLRELGFLVHEPQGAYYLLVDFRQLGFADDEAAANALLEHAKVATVPGRSFYQNPADGRYELRFCFALNEDKIQTALNQLSSYLNSR